MIRTVSVIWTKTEQKLPNFFMLTVDIKTRRQVLNWVTASIPELQS